MAISAPSGLRAQIPHLADPLIRRNSAFQSLWSNKQFVLKKIQQDCCAFKHASQELQDDDEVIRAACKSSWQPLQWASERVRSNGEMMLQAIKEEYDATEWVANALWVDRVFVRALLEMISEEYGVKDWVASAFWNDREFVLDMLAGSSEEEQLRIFDQISERLWSDEWVRLKAWDNKAFVLREVERDPCMLECASERLRDDGEVVRAACKRSWWPLQWASKRFRSNRTVMLQVIQEEYDATDWVTDTLWADKLFVKALLEIVVKEGNTETQRQKKSVLQKIQKGSHSFEEIFHQANSTLWRDKRFMQAMRAAFVDEKGEMRRSKKGILQTVWGNKTFVLRKIKRDSQAFKRASEELRDDDEVLLKACEDSWEPFQWASERLRGKLDLALQAIRSDKWALDWVAPSLWENTIFTQTVLEKNAPETSRKNGQSGLSRTYFLDLKLNDPYLKVILSRMPCRSSHESSTFMWTCI